VNHVKNVLMIAYHYPPEGSSSGVLRTLKFSKYLLAHGWSPHVLTLRESFYDQRDNGLLRDIPPGVVVHRTFAMDTSRHLAVRGHYPAVLAVPDRVVSWLPFGVAQGLRVIRQERISALYSTSPLPTAHLIAAALRTRTRVPWVADFRDPWVEDGLYPRPGTLRFRVESALERLVVRRADRIVATTPLLRQEFLARYPELPAGKIRVIYNGYDEADFHNLHVPGRTDLFELLHAGMVTPDYRDPLPLLRALSGLIGEGRLPQERIRLTFLGGGGWVGSPRFADEVKGLGLEGVVQVVPRIPHGEVIPRLARAASLLILQASDDTKALIPAKVFEYLRVGRPILALVFEGATSDILRGMDHCHMVTPEDQVALQRTLLALYTAWSKSPTHPSISHPIQQYERKYLTSELARLLDEVSETSPHALARQVPGLVR